MKAIVATGYGPPERYMVADMPVPRPGPGQIQVRIAAASINPADVRLPSGDFRDAVPLEFPHVPGNDFAGTISDVGAAVTAYQVGEEIFGQAVPRALRAMAGTTRPSLSTGSLAEYARPWRPCGPAASIRAHRHASTSPACTPPANSSSQCDCRTLAG